MECRSDAVSNHIRLRLPVRTHEKFPSHRFNITTGSYPFEGDNIYRLLENIGKGVWSVPEGLDPLLSDLLLNMLRFDASERFTIQEIKSHAWFVSSPLRSNEPPVSVPPLNGDNLRSMDFESSRANFLFTLLCF